MNHTYIFENQFSSVTCLYNDNNNNNQKYQFDANSKDIKPNQDCRLTLPIPSTKYFTDDYLILEFYLNYPYLAITNAITNKINTIK